MTRNNIADIFKIINRKEECIPGNQNEFDFVLALNNKQIKNLNPLLYDLIHTLFNEISDSEQIKSWKNHYKQKTDVFVKINNQKRRISIKMGSRNSVHVEELKTFIKFLKINKVPSVIIKSFLKYHYGDGTDNGTGKIRNDSKTYKLEHKDEIDNINQYFSHKKLVEKVIDRFVIKGLIFNDEIDAIVYGTPNDFLFLTRDEIKRIIINKKDMYCSAPHFGPLVCQPLNRCLNYNPKYEHCRKYIQIKWYSLFDDIIENMNNNILSNKNHMSSKLITWQKKTTNFN